MTFAGVLTSLEQGKRVRREAWPDGRWTQRHGSRALCVWRSGDGPTFVTDVDFADLLASDWELVEEPEKSEWCPCRSHDCPGKGATIARLEREAAADRDLHRRAMDMQADQVNQQAATIARLERDLAEAKRIVVSIRERGRKAISALEDI